MELFQVLAETVDVCEGLGPIVGFVKGVLTIIQIGIPIILIIMGSIDLGRAVLSSDDKEIKGATSRLIKRAIAAVAVFFVSTIVSLLMGLFSNTGDELMADEANNWSVCWKHYSAPNCPVQKDGSVNLDACK